MREARASLAQLRWLAAHEPDAFPCLLDSPSGGPLGQRALLLARGVGELVQWGDGRVDASGAGVSAHREGLLASLDAAWAAAGQGRGAHEGGGADPVPFAGGWLLYLAYEFAAQLEPRLTLPATDAHVPLAWALRVPAAIVAAVAAPGDTTGAAPGDAPLPCLLVAEAGEGARLQVLEAALARAARALAGGHAVKRPRAAQIVEDEPARFLAAVERARTHIAAGDVYQANLSRGWRLRFGDAPDVGALYDTLAGANPAPFAALARLPDGSRLLSSSPERLVRVRGARIDTRPIAGTRPRAAGEDQPERAAMLAHPKERAEHVMLIDLERNDLGRVCEPGSVLVDEFMVAESYRHVHHIVSNVSGRLRAGTTPGEVLRAVFPGGTITGCPKLRAIEVIARLEGVARGPYTGALGYLGHDGSMDMNILIRTAWLRGALLELRAGAGIVADSDARRELAETRAKALGLLRAFGAAPP